LKLPDLPNIDADLFRRPAAEQFVRVTDDHPEDHPKVQELRNLAARSEGMVWTSPERHGAMRDCA
jgi:NAD(P)H-dependent FMN reductase